ncbi:MAG: SDR family NAD(P)-dependent oxidoreductase [Clostridia bacterium]|nr:SDR family NAD(P)-dependent oxidoreductase [Clostridia bacterium]
MNIAIVTGASSGIGREFVKKLSKNEEFDQIWIIARRRERLLELELKYGEKIVPIELDLTNMDELQKFEDMLKDKNVNVKMLVNCAGFGKFGKFDIIPMADKMNMIDLNCKALVYITEAVVPFMQKGAKIIEVDSIAAFQPLPLINVYGATKAFVLNYTIAMQEELRDKGIRIYALCPGWTRTEFFETAESETKEINTFGKWFTADEIVSYALKKIKKTKKVVLTPSLINKLQHGAAKLLPTKATLAVWIKLQKKK